MDRWWIWTILAYLCGSVPFGLLIGLMQGKDLRKVGSGNLGATNAIRALGKGWGTLCLLLDIAKGLGPVLGAGLVLGYAGRTDLTPIQAFSWLAVAVAAVAGHVFPIWLKFKGGKGVATGLGSMLGFWPLLTASAGAALLIWALVVAVTRYVSLGSIAAAVSLPLFTVVCALLMGLPVLDASPFIAVTGLLAVLVLVRHRPNISRLKSGTEHRFTLRRSAPSADDDPEQSPDLQSEPDKTTA